MLVDRDVEKGKELEKSFLSFYFLSRATVSIEFHRHHYSKRTKNTCIRAYFSVSHNISYDDYLNSYPIIAHLLCGPENVVTQ